jgi:hypothetical protein
MSTSEIVVSTIYVLCFPFVIYVFVISSLFRLISRRRFSRVQGMCIFSLAAIAAFPLVLFAHWKSIPIFTSIDTEFAGFGFAMMGNVALLAIALLVSLPFAFYKLRSYAWSKQTLL